MKKLVCFALILSMLLTCFTIAAAAENTEYTSGGFRYVILEDGTAEITYYLGDKDLVIPSEIDGIPVTSINGSAFMYYSYMSSVSIPESVTSIGANPFRGCGKLTIIDVSPDHPVFEVIDGVLIDKTEKRLICYPRGLNSSEYAIPDGITVIGNSAFAGCESLMSVFIPESVTYIDNLAFSDCTSLYSVSIPESVSSISTAAFGGCASLTSIYIPESVTDISGNPFTNCSSLTEIKVSPDNPAFEVRDGVLFDNAGKRLVCYPCSSGASSYTIPDGIACIGTSAFMGCKSLTSVSIPDSVTSIGNNAFSGCESLTSVTIPDSVTSINNHAFNSCKSLTSVSIPGSVTHIGDYAFAYCKSITSFSIPDSVTHIGDNAFASCVSLASVTIPEGVSHIGNQAFDYCKALTSVTIPGSVTYIGVNPFTSCERLAVIAVSPENPIFAFVDGVLIDKTEKKLICYPCAFSASAYTIPEDIICIGNHAFYRCKSLVTVSLPDGMTEIDDYAFKSCKSLASVNFPDSITYIGDFAFDDCPEFSSVSLPSGVTHIGTDAFDYPIEYR